MLSGNKQLCTGCPGLKEALVRHFGEVEMQSNLTFYMLKSDCTLLVAKSPRFLSRYTFLPGVAHQGPGKIWPGLQVRGYKVYSWLQAYEADHRPGLLLMLEALPAPKACSYKPYQDDARLWTPQPNLPLLLGCG